jgi:hypothetical protein
MLPAVGNAREGARQSKSSEVARIHRWERAPGALRREPCRWAAIEQERHRHLQHLEICRAGDAAVPFSYFWICWRQAERLAKFSWLMPR